MYCNNGAFYTNDINNIEKNNNSNPETIEYIHATCARHLLSSGEVTKVGDYLKQTTITNADRVMYITKYLEKFKLLPKLKKPTKNNELSAKYRNQGNEAFRCKKLYAALELYNKSIAFAENTECTECLALGYANRSAILFELNYFRECKEDINRALFYNYPSDKKLKLINRLNKSTELENKSKIYKFYNEFSDEIELSNEIVKCATNKIKIEFDQKIGRYVVATENIYPGEIIAVEKPYITVLLRNYFYMNCFYCINHTLNPIPCDYCSYALFCNEECKRNAMSTYHKYECKLLTNIIESNLTKMAQLSLRIAIAVKDEYQFINENLMDDMDDLAKLGLSPDKNGKLVLDSNYIGIHYLITNTKFFPVNELFHKSIVASVLLNLLKQIHFFEENTYSKAEDTAAELLLRHLQTAPSNFHQISALKAITESYSESEAFADGAYPFLSMLNHSCAPNIFRSIHGVQMVVRALRPIKKGDQLFDSYGYHHALATKSERKGALKDQYFFECKCEACENNWPTWQELVMHRKNLPDLKFLEDIMPEVSQRKVSAKALTYIPKMEKMLSVLENEAPCVELCELQETYKEIHCLQGNVFTILKAEVKK